LQATVEHHWLCRDFSSAWESAIISVLHFLDCQMEDTHYEDILGKQLAMNRQTWAALQKHGVAEGRQLRLDFSYNAPNRVAADTLCVLLRGQTDYEVEVESGGSFLRRKWRVEGRTHNTAVSPALLDQWVTWMVNAGKEQSCDFDGWGARV
jgi:hypothetical protein